MAISTSPSQAMKLFTACSLFTPVTCTIRFRASITCCSSFLLEGASLTCSERIRLTNSYMWFETIWVTISLTSQYSLFYSIITWIKAGMAAGVLLHFSRVFEKPGSFTRLLSCSTSACVGCVFFMNYMNFFDGKDFLERLWCFFTSWIFFKACMKVICLSSSGFVKDSYAQLPNIPAIPPHRFVWHSNRSSDFVLSLFYDSSCFFISGIWFIATSFFLSSSCFGLLG